MSKWAATLGGVLVLALFAGGLTEATLVLGQRGKIVDDTLLRPEVTASPSSAPKSSPSPDPVPTPLATPIPTPVVPMATTNSFVRMRAGKSTSTAILFELNGGTAVRLLLDRDAQWQQVEYSGKTGYIFRLYLTY